MAVKRLVGMPGKLPLESAVSQKPPFVKGHERRLQPGEGFEPLCRNILILKLPGGVAGKDALQHPLFQQLPGQGEKMKFSHADQSGGDVFHAITFGLSI